MVSSAIFQYKQAWLSLKNKPGFIATVVITMGSTLGALICVLTLAYLLFLQPLPYPEQNRLHQVEHSYLSNENEKEYKGFNFPTLFHIYKNEKLFDESILLFYAQNVVTSLPHQPTIPVAFVSHEFMNVLDTPMALGRRFDEREALNTQHPVVILNYETWFKDFSADPDILSKKIEFKGRQYQVIGVTAKAFIEPKIYRKGINTGLWFPFDFHLGQNWLEHWGINDNLTMLVKVKENQNIVEVNQTLSPIINDLWHDNNSNLPEFTKHWSAKIKLVPLSEVLLGRSSNTVYLLLAGVLGLIIIAITNITNLFISRTAEQQRILAIQAALGAKKSQLIRLILAESSILMALSIIVALSVSSVGFYLISTYLASILPRVDELKINTITFIFALLLAGLSAVYFALIGSKMINYKALSTQLQSSGKGTGIQVSKRIRQILISSQVAIAMLLIFSNLTLFHRAVNEISTPSGFSLENMFHTSFSVSAPSYPDGDVVQPIMYDLQQELTQLPKIESVEVSYSPLAKFFGTAFINPYTNKVNQIEGKEVGKDYFTMTQQKLIAGEFFSDENIKNNSDKQAFIIINDVFAQSLDPNKPIIGKKMAWSDRSVTIIGIVKGIKFPGTDSIPRRIYTPVKPDVTKMNIKLLPNQTLERKEVVNAIKKVTSLYALYGLENLAESEKELLFSQYTTAITTAALTIITLLLAAIGLYGILSYGTQMRRFEIGTRMAIGAKTKDIIFLIMKENSVVIFIGIAISMLVLIAIYLTFTTQITAYLSYTLLTIYILTLVVITVLCLLACYWPLRQYIKQPAIYSLQGGH